MPVKRRTARRRLDLPEAVRLLLAGEVVPDTPENRMTVLGLAYFSDHGDLELEPVAHAQLAAWREAGR